MKHIAAKNITYRKVVTGISRKLENTEFGGIAFLGSTDVARGSAFKIEP